MANKSVIVIKKPGEIITQAYVQRVVNEYTTYMGTALVYENQLVIDHQKGKPSVEAVMKLQDEFKDLQVVLVFGENKTILDEDMQPFEVLLDKESDTKIALALEGNFEGYTMKGSSHTNEWHCKEEFLAKKLPKLYRAANAGLPGLVTELQDEITQQDLSNSWTDRGFITLLSTAGPALSISNKGHVFKADYNWGSTSNSLNYVEQTVAKTEAKPGAKPMSALEALRAKMRGEKVETEKPAPKDLPAEKPTETSVILPKDDEYEVVGPAPANLNNADKIKWWINEVGYKPDRYKKADCKIKRKIGTKVGLLAPLASTNVKEEEKPKVAAVASAMKVDPKTLPDKKEAPEAAKDTAPKHVSMENMPILSPRQKINLQKTWMQDEEVVKLLGDNFQALAQDPKKLKDFEDNFQTFKSGMGLPENLWLSFEALGRMGAVEFKALQQYAFNCQNEAIALKIQNNSLLADIIPPGRAVM